MKTCNIDDCNIYRAQKFIKHKWVPIIIFCINLDVTTFNGLLKQIDHISNEQLTRGLKLLITNDILSYHDGNYHLTSKGEKINEIIELMVNFDE